MAVVNLFPFCRPVLEKSVGHLAGLNYLASHVVTELLLLQRRTPLQKLLFNPSQHRAILQPYGLFTLSRGVGMYRPVPPLSGVA